MNYIYDVVLNFNKDYYNFFEWYKSDNIINIKKIPFFLVDNNTYTSMKYNIIIVDQDFVRKTKLVPTLNLRLGLLVLLPMVKKLWAFYLMIRVT